MPEVPLGLCTHRSLLPEHTPPNSAGGEGLLWPPLPGGAGPGAVVPVLEYAVPPGQSTRLSLLGDPGAPTSCLHKGMGEEGEEA